MMAHVRPATLADIPALVALMAEFYAEAGFALPEGPAARAFEALVGDPRLGGVWLAGDENEPAGHVVLTLCFTMEYGGLRGIIDDLYVRPAARGRGVGAALLAAAREGAVARGARALQVEVGPENEVACRLYARAGYTDAGHLLLGLPLAPPVHAA